MEIWKAHYKDKLHDVDCTIENHYFDKDCEETLKMCIDGIEFYGSELDDWELSETLNEIDLIKAGNKFSLFKYGSNAENYNYMLQDYILDIKIPTTVFSIDTEKCITGELNITFSKTQDNNTINVRYPLDNGFIKPPSTNCSRFALIVENQYFEAECPNVFFDISLESICKQISGKYYLCNCFGCLYSDYSPYGNGNIGSIFCFMDIKETYLRVNGKHSEDLIDNECTIWEAFDKGGIQCLETGYCKNFAPRINCKGGYRGQIYK